jgi:DNA repair protein RadC
MKTQRAGHRKRRRPFAEGRRPGRPHRLAIEVLEQRALRLNAAAVVLFHYTPSGAEEPAEADRVLVQRLKAALGLVEIRVLDHMVVGIEGSLSFVERGWL